jgi:hypothetical protein
MIPDLEWAEWAPQAPMAKFVDQVERAVTLKKIGAEEWLPQRPDEDFALVATAQITRLACRQTQQTSTGMRVVRAILGDDIYGDLLSERDEVQSERRSLLVHMFLRWSQYDAERALGLALLLTSNEQIARSIVTDAVEWAARMLPMRANTQPWLVAEDTGEVEIGSRRRRSVSQSQIQRFVQLSMERACDVARHFVSTEHDSRAVVRRAFLFFVDSAMPSRRKAR